MVKIAIISPSEIALRRFLPALSLSTEYEFAGVAVADYTEWENLNKEILDKEKIRAESFINSFGGKMYMSYQSLLDDERINAIYIPLPPALHFQWAKKALLANKHVFVEKPATTKMVHSKELIKLATDKELALHENYMSFS